MTGVQTCALPISDNFDLSGMPRASGGFADVRVEVLKGKAVAVKTLRVAELDDKIRIRKVGNRAGASHPDSLTHCAAVLQRGSCVGKPFPSQRSRPHWNP